VIAGEMGCDRADLLIAGEEQEGRRAAIALDADRKIIRLGMRQLPVAVRRRRAAGMQVRIDHGPKRARAFQPRVQIQPKLARHRQVGTLAGADNDAVDRSKHAARLGTL